MELSEETDAALAITVKGYRQDFYVPKGALLELVRDVRHRVRDNRPTYGGYCVECGANEMWEFTKTEATFCDTCAETFADTAETYAEENAGEFIGIEL